MRLTPFRAVLPCVEAHWLVSISCACPSIVNMDIILFWVLAAVLFAAFSRRACDAQDPGRRSGPWRSRRRARSMRRSIAIASRRGE